MALKTKGEHINKAYTELRISGITVNATPEENAIALDSLEDMMAELEDRNICLNYNFEETPDPSTNANVQRPYNNMIATNLAVRLLASFGKTANETPSLFQQATQSLSWATNSTAVVNETKYPRRQAMGQGNTFRWNRWRRYFPEDPNVVISCETNNQPLNTIRDYTETWDTTLPTGETITSFEADPSNGLEVTASSIGSDSRSIDFTVKSAKAGVQEITISIVTDVSTPENRDVRIVNFNVENNNTLDGN